MTCNPIHFLLLLFFLSPSLGAQSQPNTDSLLMVISSAPNNAAKLDSINKILSPIRDVHIAGLDTLFRIRQKLLVNHGDQQAKIDAAVTHAFYLVKSFMPAESKKIIEPYYDKLDEIESRLQQADVLYAYAHCHEDLRENEKAFNLMNQSVSLYEEVGDSSYDQYTQALIALSRVGFTISEYASSSIALNKAKSLALRNKDSTALRGVHQDLTILFSQIGLYDEAEAYWNERSRYFSTPESNESKAIGLVNLGRNLILQDRWAEALNNYHTAQSYSPFVGGWTFMDVYNYNGIIECLYFLNRRDSIPFYFDLLRTAFDDIDRSVTYEFLLKQSAFLTNVATGQFSSAEKIGLSLLANAEQSSDGAEIMMHARFLAELYEESGNSAEALKYNKRYVHLRDSIQTANRTNALLLYQTQFETAEKENEIFRLEKEGELLNTKIERNRLFRALLIAGLALLILCGIIIYYRIKQKELIKMQDLRMGISSDLHDEVGSLLSGVTMQTQMLSAIPEEKRPAFIKEIGENTRKAVTTMRDLVWSIDSRRDKIEDLKDKIADTCHQLLEPAGFEYEIHLDDRSDRIKKINPKSKKEVYLIAKEAINNIVKHSSGRQVNITLAEQNKALQLTIEDNGNNAKNASKSGQGLENMQYRANSVGGKFKIDQSDDHFEVQVLVPL